MTITDFDAQEIRNLIYQRDGADTPEEKDRLENFIIYCIDNLVAGYYVVGRDSLKTDLRELLDIRWNIR